MRRRAFIETAAPAGLASLAGLFCKPVNSLHHYTARTTALTGPEPTGVMVNSGAKRRRRPVREAMRITAISPDPLLNLIGSCSKGRARADKLMAEQQRIVGQRSDQITALRQRVGELEAAVAGCRQAESELRVEIEKLRVVERVVQESFDGFSVVDRHYVYRAVNHV